MNELLQEFTNSRGATVRVDAARGVIRGVKLLGLESRNGRRYLPAALRQAAALYDGAKVNVNHPKGSPLAARDYQDRLGTIRNVTVSDEGLFGELHYNPKHALAEQLAWDAQHAPENVGFSHNVEARTSRSGGQTIVEAILKVQSVDLVADPATTRGLYESEAAKPAEADATVAWQDITIETLREHRPDLIEQILTDASTERDELRAEVDRLQAREAVQARCMQARRLLAEYRLPDPEVADPMARRLVGELFWEALLAAPSDTVMRRMVQERAELVAAAQRDLPSRGGPTSREQGRAHSHRTGADEPLNVDEFVRAIT